MKSDSRFSNRAQSSSWRLSGFENEEDGAIFSFDLDLKMKNTVLIVDQVPSVPISESNQSFTASNYDYNSSIPLHPPPNPSVVAVSMEHPDPKGSTTRRAVSSSVPTSPATFAEIIRRADEILRRPESGNPGRSVKPIRVGKPRSVGKTNTGRETQDGRQPRTSGCNPPFQAEEQYPDLQVRRSRPTSMTDSYFTKSEIYWSQGNKERFRNKKEKARKDNTNNNGTFWNLTWISRSDRPKRK
ncbi:hypothetical protein U1Q18_043255 [Sarracenia purpurea var. burkii]